MAAGAAAASWGSGPAARAESPSATLPPIRHVFVINLENTSYDQSFGDSCCGLLEGSAPHPHPYLKDVLPSRGLLLRKYYAIGHNSLDNYIAQVSGQAPNPDTQADCASGNTDFESAGTDPHGQAIGQGCVYPSSVKTLADQLSAKGLTWKGYMEGLGNTAGPPGTGDGEPCGQGNGQQNTDLYAAKHNPYVWFHSLADQASCAEHVVPLTALGRDLQSVATSPNVSFLSPDLCDDAHESECGLDRVDEWLQRWVPLILASPAYRQDGMVVVTFDEAATAVGVGSGDNTAACCNEIPGPNSPMPGASGPGGGVVGAVILSPYVKPGTTSDVPYNHYSLLRSIEDLFGIASGGDDGHGHLGFAGSYDATYPGPGSFGCDVYDFYGPCQSPAGSPGPTPPAPVSGRPTGPRAADGSAAPQNPLPVGNDLTSISCPTASSCFATGEAGTIVATGNSGSTWSSQRSGTASDLSGVSCPRAGVCVAVGDAGTIVTAGSDGGTWTKRQAGTARNLRAVSCPTADRCYAAGDGGTILASSDGGQSWAAQNSGTSSALRGISCPDASTCYAVGDVYAAHQGTAGTSYTNEILKSVDGGSTWILRDTGVFGRRLHSVSCPTASTCFAGGDAESIFSTADGGTTWKLITAVRARSLGIACASATDCVAVGAHFAAFDTTPSGGILSTSDGQSFSPQDSGTSDDLRGVACPTAALCYAVGDRGTIVARTDGGHWTTQTRTATRIPAALDSPREPATSAPQLAGASCPTTSACFAVGDGGIIAATSDGGAHWSAQNSNMTARLSAIDCASASACTAVGDGGTVVAFNGVAWSKQDAGTTEALAGVSCPSASTCFAVGDRGTIVATTDRGASWHVQRSNTGVNLNAIDCASTTVCTAVGSLGTILKTTDGGSTWTAQSSGTTAYLGGVSCPTTKSCYAVGEGGTVVVGGKSWSAKSTGAGDELNSISCASGSSCVASGSLGTVLSTADGAKSWTVQGTGTARELAAVSCPSGTGCFAAGDTGTILRVTPQAGGRRR